MIDHMVVYDHIVEIDDVRMIDQSKQYVTMEQDSHNAILLRYTYSHKRVV
jgi:hypothetical protein